MRKASLAMAMAIFFVWNCSYVYAAKFAQENMWLMVDQSEIHTKPAGEDFLLQYADSVEEAYRKIIEVMKELKDGEAYEILVLGYPEEHWYQLLSKLEKTGKYEMIPVVKRIEGHEEYFIWIRNK